MPIKHFPSKVVCALDVSKTIYKKPNELLVEEQEDDDTELALGWVELTARRVVQNPDFKTEREALFEAEWKGVMETQKGWTEKQSQSFIRENWEAICAQAEVLGRLTEPPLIVQEVTEYYSPEQANRLHSLIKLPSWEE